MKLQDSPDDSSDHEGGRKSPIGSTGDEEEEEGRDQGNNSPEKPLPVSTTGNDCVPSSSGTDGLPGTASSTLVKVADVHKTKQDVEEDVEETTPKKQSKSQKSGKERRLWGLWGGIKERLRPTESRQEKNEDVVRETVAEEEGEGEGEGGGGREGEVGKEGEGGGGGEKRGKGVRVVRYMKNTELTAEGATSVSCRKKEKEDTKKEDKLSEKQNESQRHPHSHRVSRMVHMIENPEDTGRSQPEPSQLTRTRQRSKKIPGGAAKPLPNPKPASLKTQPDRRQDDSSNGSSSPIPSTADKLQRLSQPMNTAQTTNQAESARPIRAVHSQRTTQKSRTAHPMVATEHHTTPTTEKLPNLPIFTPHSDTKSHLPAHLDKPLPTNNLKVDTSQISDPIICHLLVNLQQQAVENDYYRLFGVDSSASSEDLARVRREKSRQLHPDHFVNQPVKKERYGDIQMCAFTYCSYNKQVSVLRCPSSQSCICVAYVV